VRNLGQGADASAADAREVNMHVYRVLYSISL
jgi:hypothetical protein